MKRRDWLFIQISLRYCTVLLHGTSLRGLVHRPCTSFSHVYYTLRCGRHKTVYKVIAKSSVWLVANKLNTNIICRHWTLKMSKKRHGKFNNFALLYVIDVTNLQQPFSIMFKRGTSHNPKKILFMNNARQSLCFYILTIMLVI